MKYMLDTNICIYAIKGGNTHLDQRLDECETRDLVMSAITLGKLEAGSAKGTAPVPLGTKQRLSFKRSPSSPSMKPPHARSAECSRKRRRDAGPTTGRSPHTPSRLA